MSRAWGALAAALLFIPLVGAEEDALSDEERAWLDQHAPIRYGYEPGYAPFEFRDRQGHAVGINFDLLDAISRNLGVRIEKIEYPDFEALQQGIRNGSLDVIGTVNQTSEREKFLDFSDPYVRLSSAFYVTDDHPEVASIEDLAGLKVGIVESYVSGEWLIENHPEMAITPAPDLDTLVDWLATNQVDAVFEETATLGYLIRENGLTHVRVLDEGPFLQSDQHWAVPDGAHMVVSILNKGMATIPPGERTRIFEYWTNYDLGIHPPATGFSPLARNILLVTGGTLLLLTLWTLTLRRRVAVATQDLRNELERRHLAEDRARELNKRLEARVEERTQQLQQSNHDLEQFARTVSHDLRSPLSVIRLNARLLEGIGDGDERILKSANRISRTVGHMDDLIQSTLAYSRANAHDVKADLDLREVARQAARLVEADAPQARITVEDLPKFHASKPQMRQLFQNLIGNAVKYARDGTQSRVRVWSETRDGYHYIHVEDNGVGFDVSRLEEMLQPFTRQEETQDRPGHGLGLAACARILERHGGHLEATSDPRIGTRMTVAMPAAPGADDTEAKHGTLKRGTEDGDPCESSSSDQEPLESRRPFGSKQPGTK